MTTPKAENRLCDFLLAAGIDGKPDQEALDHITHLNSLAIKLGRKDAVERTLAWHETLSQRTLTDEQAVALDLSWANAIGNERYGTAWKWEQSPLAREIYLLRRAVSRNGFVSVSSVLKCKCFTNLGNRLEVAGRLVEALECWRRALEVQPQFGMALCNRAIGFYTYASALEDSGKRSLLLWMAHKEATAAMAPKAIYTDSSDQANRDRTGKLREYLGSILDIPRIEALNPLDSEDASASEEEREYRTWCTNHCLYLNYANDLGPYAVANHDFLGIGTHAVDVATPHLFDSFFDQMEQEYVSARWLLYEGTTGGTTHFSDKGVALAASEPRPALSLRVEKLKAAYRMSYSLFDKIGYFINAYMQLGIPKDRVSFRNLWRPDKTKPIRSQFDLHGNWAFCALYWLAKDFYEDANDQVVEPQALDLGLIRNHLEHKYLRITVAETPAGLPTDLAFSVSREQFAKKALHLLRLARSALIYLSLGVGFEEQRRNLTREESGMEEFAVTPLVPDSEKI
jgi:hypothetical protein